MYRKFAAKALALAAIACVPPSPVEGGHRYGMSAFQQRGYAFAVQRCSGCHAVTANRTSPNPEAPSFEDIANRSEVTAASLREFLRDSHNYPEAMDFRVDEAQLNDLSDFIAAQREPDYRPVM